MNTSLRLLLCLLPSAPALAANVINPVVVSPSVASAAKPASVQAPSKPVVKKVAPPVARLAVSDPAPAAANPANPAEPPAPSAAQPTGPSIADLSQALRNYFTEEETAVLYQFMKDSLVASLKGDEADALPPDLAFKMEVLIARMKREGGAYMERLSQEMEADLKKRTAPPPPTEYVPSRPWPQNNPWLTR